MRKIVSNQILPNFRDRDAAATIFAAAKFWQKPEKKILENFFGSKNFFLTNAARTGISEILKILKIAPKKKIVALPALICAVVAVPFLRENWQILWIDTDACGRISRADFAKKADKFAVAVVPHIFGQKIEIEKFAEICREKNIFLIEDCAHFLPNLRDQNFAADARIFSFGREKILSTISGGAVQWPQNSILKKNFSKIKLPKSKFFWTLRHIFQPLIFAVALRFWRAGGAILPRIFLKIGFLPRAVSKNEKRGIADFPRTKMPAAMQKILVRQILNLKKIAAHREKIAKKWCEILPKIFPDREILVPKNFFRIILLAKNSAEKTEILRRAKKIGFFLSEWDGAPISPAGTDLPRFFYEKKMCENAENFAEKFVNFPTNLRTEIRDVEFFAKNFSRFSEK